MMNLFNYFLQKCLVLLLEGLLQQAGRDVSFSKAKQMLVLVTLEVKVFLKASDLSILYSA